MLLRIFFFLVILALSTNSHAQWWVDGGNVIWPYGDVKIPKGDLYIDGDSTFIRSEFIVDNVDGYAWMRDVWGDPPVTQNKIFSQQESWWGGLAVVNFSGNNNRRVLQPNSRQMILDLKSITMGDTLAETVGSQIHLDITPNPDSSSVWRKSWIGISANNVAIKFNGDGLPHPSNPLSAISGYNFFEDGFGQSVVDTLGFKLFGYHFRFGAGNKLRYPETYAFFSDLVSYNAATKILNGNAYHFYGKGDFPSYFGGATIQKVYTPDVSNPPTSGELESEFGNASDAGSGFTVYIDDSGEGSNFYQVVSDGNVWWVFTASQAP